MVKSSISVSQKIPKKGKGKVKDYMTSSLKTNLKTGGPKRVWTTMSRGPTT